MRKTYSSGDSPGKMSSSVLLGLTVKASPASWSNWRRRGEAEARISSIIMTLLYDWRPKIWIMAGPSLLLSLEGRGYRRG
jgi:hypothetical protein